MFTNSQLWSKYNAIGDVAAKKQLEQLNQQLGASIGAQYDSTSGTWTINGKNIYDDLERATRDNITETIDNTDITDLLNDTERKSNTLLNTVNTALTNNTNSLSSLEESLDDNTKALNNSGSSNNNSSNSNNGSSSSSSGSNISLENASISIERSNGYTYYTARNPQNYNEILGTKTVDKNGNVIDATGLYSGELNKKPSNNNTDTNKPTTPPSSTETTPEKKKYYLYTFNDNGKNVTIESEWSRYDLAHAEAVEKKLLSSSAKFVGSTGYIYKHDGIASGYIGDTQLTNEKKNLLKDIALGNTQLKSDEVPAVLQKGEGVFTVEQLNNLANAFIEQRTPINPLTIKRNIANNIVSPTQSQQIIEKGDSYIFQNVTIKSDNLDTFVKQIRLYSKR